MEIEIVYLDVDRDSMYSIDIVEIVYVDSVCRCPGCERGATR